MQIVNEQHVIFKCLAGGVSLPSAWVHPVRPCRRGRRRSQGTAHATGCFSDKSNPCVTRAGSCLLIGLRCGKSHAVRMDDACTQGLMNLIPGVQAPPPTDHTPTGHVPVFPGAFRSQIVRGNRTSE